MPAIRETTVDELTWYIAGRLDTSDTGKPELIIHYGELPAGSLITSGQKTVVLFSDKDEWISALKDRGIRYFEDETGTILPTDLSELPIKKNEVAWFNTLKKDKSFKKFVPVKKENPVKPEKSEKIDNKLKK